MHAAMKLVVYYSEDVNQEDINAFSTSSQCTIGALRVRPYYPY